MCECFCVCVSSSLWDTVSRELCWLVKGLVGQWGGNNTSSSPLCSLPPPHFLAVSHSDEVGQGHFQVSDMVSGHQHTAISASCAYGLYQSSQHEFMCHCLQLGNRWWKQWSVSPIRRQNIINKPVCACECVCGCRCAYEKNLFQLINILANQS